MSAARRTVGVGATLASGSQLATALLGGLMGIVVARVLGPADTGLFNVVLTAQVLLLTMALFGLQTGGAYYVSAGIWAPGEAHRQLLLAAFILGAVTAGVGVGLAVALSDSAFRNVPLEASIVGFSALPFALAWQYTANVALAEYRYETFAASSVAQNALALVLACALAPLAGLVGAVVALTAAHLLNAARLTAWAVRALPAAERGWLRRAPRELRRAGAFGIQSHLSAVLQYFNLRGDLFVLNTIAAPVTVGRYAVAVAVTELGLMLPRALTAVLFPRIAALGHAGGEGERRMVIEKSVRHTLLLMPLTALVLVVGLLAVPLVYGADFSPATGLGTVLVPGIVLLGAANVLSATVLGKGQPRWLLISALGVTPPTLLLYVLLIPSLGGYGAALASSLSYAGLSVVTFAFFRRATKGDELGRLVPGREELREYRTLAKTVRARVRGRGGN